MKIGELAAHTGTTAKTIRYYESIGLMSEPGRTSANYRDYGADAIERLAFIRDSQGAGLTLAEIGSIVELKDAGQSTCGHTREILHRHLADIEEQIKSLHATKAAMLAMAERADAMDPGACQDPNRCQVIESGISAAREPGSRTQLKVAAHA